MHGRRMDGPLQQAEEHNGLGDPGLLRYVLLYAAQASWVLLGLWLLHGSQWPSTCMPDGLVAIYNCSARLPESGRWHEYALLTWLWSSPILVVLELMRRLGIGKE